MSVGEQAEQPSQAISSPKHSDLLVQSDHQDVLAKKEGEANKTMPAGTLEKIAAKLRRIKTSEWISTSAGYSDNSFSIKQCILVIQNKYHLQEIP